MRPTNDPCDGAEGGFAAGERSASGSASSGASAPLPPPILELSHHDSLSWARNGVSDAHRARHSYKYRILRPLGRGAFCSTFQVRNCVDYQLYAMKCVKFMLGGAATGPRRRTGPCGVCEGGFGSDDCRKVLREVEVLSGLRSDNIVRYYSAWVERAETADVVAPGDADGVGAGWSGSSPTDVSSASTASEWTEESLKQSGSADTAIGAALHPVCGLCHSTYKDWEVSFEHWGLIDAVLQPLDLCTACYMKSIPPNVDVTSITIREKRVLHEYLFILMEYCDMTLNEAVVQFRTKSEGEGEGGCYEDVAAKLWSLFGQCVQGLAHLHSRGVVHRDIKPTNIFVLDGVAKIGDMGLATYLESGGDPGSSSSSDVGTYLYMAPETKKGQYSDKCDIFALGVVLIEIFSDFATGMERAVVLERFRADGTLPKDWEAKYPVQAQLARRMAASDPASRPSSGQVLGELLREGLARERPDPTILANAVADMHEQMKAMQTKLRQFGEENVQLRRLLDEKGIPHDHIGQTTNGASDVGSKQDTKGCSC